MLESCTKSEKTLDSLKTEDSEGNTVILNRFPGVGTCLEINGNVFRINYTKEKGRKFSAEFLRPSRETDNIKKEI